MAIGSRSSERIKRMELKARILVERGSEEIGAEIPLERLVTEAMGLERKTARVLLHISGDSVYQIPMARPRGRISKRLQNIPGESRSNSSDDRQESNTEKVVQLGTGRMVTSRSSRRETETD
jgi:hypothetical protein